MNTAKYKTVLCKHYGQNGTCSYGDKCQFAHGFQELKSSIGTDNINNHDPTKPKTTPDPSNFKIVKCKNWESSGSCKYGSVCTFAHGDFELRTKSDNTQQLGLNPLINQMSMPNPMMYYQDPNYFINMILQQQMITNTMSPPVDMNQYNIMNMGMGMGLGYPETHLNDHNMLYMGMQPQFIPQGMYDMNYAPYNSYDMNPQSSNINNIYMGVPYTQNHMK